MFPLCPSVQTSSPNLRPRRKKKKNLESPGSEEEQEVDKSCMNIWDKY